MNTTFDEKHRKALLISLFQRIKHRLQFLTNKKSLIIDGLVKESDAARLKKIRDDISKQ